MRRITIDLPSCPPTRVVSKAALAQRLRQWLARVLSISEGSIEVKVDK